ncbi:hypothetical protein E2C01_082195 [Portunus trituberculatus]|uniref:Uncharacterized protein n=1 Tax=Portunus trituberculatus TaxID=210409 RepID=A0A5B7IXU1_PORTR|nr:hypothetical protein [Portunus trituberculatus]
MQLAAAAVCQEKTVKLCFGQIRTEPWLAGVTPATDSSSMGTWTSAGGSRSHGNKRVRKNVTQ